MRQALLEQLKHSFSVGKSFSLLHTGVRGASICLGKKMLDDGDLSSAFPLPSVVQLERRIPNGASQIHLQLFRSRQLSIANQYPLYGFLKDILGVRLIFQDCKDKPQPFTAVAIQDGSQCRSHIFDDRAIFGVHIFLAQIESGLLVVGHVHDASIVSSHDHVFQKNCGGNVIPNCASTKIHRELLFALESARTRLAVAIATETKSTPVDQWHYYLDTADRICRLTKKLRASAHDWDPRLSDWIRALNALRQISVHDKARPLCRVLEDIVAELE
jgi:hypothetical protein